MFIRRIIFCLDVRNGRVVKGKKFKDIVDVDSLEVFGKFYSDCGVDEFVFYDIIVLNEERKIFLEFVIKVVENINILFCVGGGVNKLEDFIDILRKGVDKVFINLLVVKNFELIREVLLKFGV